MCNCKTKEMLVNAINYIAELKERESKAERVDFFKNVIGMTDADIQEFKI